MKIEIRRYGKGAILMFDFLEKFEERMELIAISDSIINRKGKSKEIEAKIMAISSSQLCDVANECLQEEQFTHLHYM